LEELEVVDLASVFQNSERGVLFEDVGGSPYQYFASLVSLRNEEVLVRD